MRNINIEIDLDIDEFDIIDLKEFTVLTNEAIEEIGFVGVVASGNYVPFSPATRIDPSEGDIIEDLEIIFNGVDITHLLGDSSKEQIEEALIDNIPSKEDLV